MTYTVTARGLRKAYGSHVVLDGVDLSVRTGSVFALLGPNGAGKTTVVRMLATLTRPDDGEATVAGFDLRTQAADVRASISLTGQYAAVDDALTGEENLRLMARLLHLDASSARRRTTELLAAFDLVEAGSRRVKTYSGGMRRRLDLAVSLIARPPLVFLDEPTTGLDPRSREQTWTAVRDLVAGGTTIFLTTQYLEEADRLADEVALLDGGRVVARGTPHELKSGLAGEVIRLAFTDEAHLAAAAHALRAYESVPATAEREIAISTGGTPDELRRVLCDLDHARTPAASVSLHRPTLDDVFMSLTAGEMAR